MLITVFVPFEGIGHKSMSLKLFLNTLNDVAIQKEDEKIRPQKLAPFETMKCKIR